MRASPYVPPNIEPHYPDFLITYCIHAFENYVQSIVLYGLRFYSVGIFTFKITLTARRTNHLNRLSRQLNKVSTYYAVYKIIQTFYIKQTVYIGRKTF